ncbi:GGDEF domain-containing protein [Desulfovibrio aminophilus]|uniref:GGDEF domain-containing protein n=1 Tax=Desulfovibrio aminophilus TaxID=81425 RepID=UPI00042718BA|nr:GGDEF domain-containing protein [Desulfovibrio aminophilus]
MQIQTTIFTLGGEFADPARESEFRAERMPEWLRYCRLAFFWAALLNALFYANDFLRFLGTPHFAVAVTARSILVFVSLVCLALLRRVRGFRELHTLGLVWCAAAVPACAVLLSPQTEAALFFLFVLPIIYTQGFPLAFRAAAVVSLLGSGLALAFHLAGKPWAAWELGLLLALVTENAVLLLLLSRSNRLQRQEWTASRAAERAGLELDEHRRMLQTLLKAVPAPLLVLSRSHGALFQANAAARRFFGEAACSDAASIRACFRPEDFARLTSDLPPAGEVAEHEIRVFPPDGPPRDMLLVATTAVAGGRETVLAILVDVTRRKEMEVHLQWLASTDPLTGLANRSRFFEEAAREIGRARRNGHSLAVLMVDIDYFKRINDTCGHDVGDAALRAFAGLCGGLLRGQDLAARLGGEEFGLLLPETDGEGGLVLAERLRAGVEGMRLEGLAGPMTISVGVAEVLPGEEGVDAALSRADHALYEAKRAGRNRAVAYACPSQGEASAGA